MTRNSLNVGTGKWYFFAPLCVWEIFNLDLSIFALYNGKNPVFSKPLIACRRLKNIYRYYKAFLKNGGKFSLSKLWHFEVS
jgi:hypothetical protein